MQTATTHTRMNNPALILPDALRALVSLDKSTKNAGVPPTTIGLIHLRTSQINGCSVCVDAAFRKLKESGETDQRIFTVAAWRDTPYFSEAERAALALAESVTRLSDSTDAVPDEIWDEAVRHYDEPALAAMIVQIALENAWNRLNTSVRQVAGAIQW